MKLFGFALALSLLFASSVRADGFSSQIKGIDIFGKTSGIAFTDDALYRTDDNGQTWIEVPLGLSFGETISGARFLTRSIAWAVILDRKTMTLELARTADGGSTWSRSPIELPSDGPLEADLDRLIDIQPSYRDEHPYGSGILRLRLTTSSNFDGDVIYLTEDGGKTWKVSSTRMDLNSGDRDFSEKLNGETVVDWAEYDNDRWRVTQTGSCAGFKVGCLQETKLYAAGSEITPPQIRELAAVEREAARREAVASPLFALPPGGTTRVSLNRGFDQCNAPSITSMQAWWNSSPHYNANIYMSGRARACSAQPNLNVNWINQVTAMGWGLIPTVVGYQSPCIDSSTYSGPRHSIEVAVAEQQGRGEADIAVADANNLGLTSGSILYYDMERYDEIARNVPGCRLATTAFLKGWTDRMHELSYISGVYGSPKNAQEDWVNLPPASKMDVIWMARWDNVPSVWTYISFPSFPLTEWTNHQRIKQWQAPHNETWGGVTINIDGNILDAPVAGIAVEKNRPADFDGDRRTDLSVFRPSTGEWFVLNSSSGSPSGVQFGLGTDILAPGDFDGDGKTDHAVFRPSDGTWHILTKAGFYSTRPFGTSGDIPVAADYNGDGKADHAVFRPSDGIWYIANSDSQGTYSFIQFGLAGDKPVPADYDNDGRADVGVYRLNGSGQEWWVQRSTDGFLATVFGGPGDAAVQGDYTGDGRADIAFWRPSDGHWYILRSEDFSYYAFGFGQNGDIPVPGYYDGDNRVDTAVFRPSDGVWYILRSMGGFDFLAFGQNGDRPVPAAYVPQ